MTELLPCPFCGGEAEVQHQIHKVGVDFLDWYGVYCKNPFCGHVCGYDTEAEAIAAWNTRTHGTLTAEQVREAIFNGSSYASYDGAKYYADGISMQAIADELNSRAERSCRIVKRQEDWQYNFGVKDYGFSCGHTIGWAHTYEPKYCPNCGAKVVE